MAEYIPMEEFGRSDFEERTNQETEELNREIENTNNQLDNNIPTNPDEFLLPDIPTDLNDYPNLKIFKNKANLELENDYQKRLKEHFSNKFNFDYTKFLDVFVNSNGDVFIKSKRSNDWSQLTKKGSKNQRNKEFIDIKDLKIIKTGDGRIDKTFNENLANIINDESFRIEKRIDVTHPIEDTINDVSKIMEEMGVEPDNINEIYKNRQIIKDPEIARILMTLKQYVDEYQKLLNEERDVESSKTLKPEEKEQRLGELKELIDKVENDVLKIVNGSLAREIDKNLNVPLLTKIRNILKREGLTIAAIAGVIGTIISTLFSIVFSVKAFSGNNSPGPKPDPSIAEKIYKKIKEVIYVALNKLVSLLKKLATWALTTLPTVIGPIIAWLLERAADIVKYVAENTFIIIMLSLGLGFKFIIDYLEKKKRH